MEENDQSNIESDGKAALIYHVIYDYEGFDEAAQAIFKLLQRAQQVQPGKARKLFLDIEGHRNAECGYDTDMLELQQGFLLGSLAQFFTEIHCPLCNATNSKAQENEIPPELIIKLP